MPLLSPPLGITSETAPNAIKGHDSGDTLKSEDIVGDVGLQVGAKVNQMMNDIGLIDSFHRGQVTQMVAEIVQGECRSLSGTRWKRSEAIGLAVAAATMKIDTLARAENQIEDINLKAQMILAEAYGYSRPLVLNAAAVNRWIAGVKQVCGNIDPAAYFESQTNMPVGILLNTGIGAFARRPGLSEAHHAMLRSQEAHMSTANAKNMIVEAFRSLDENAALRAEAYLNEHKLLENPNGSPGGGMVYGSHMVKTTRDVANAIAVDMFHDQPGGKEAATFFATYTQQVVSRQVNQAHLAANGLQRDDTATLLLKEASTGASARRVGKKTLMLQLKDRLLRHPEVTDEVADELTQSYGPYLQGLTQEQLLNEPVYGEAQDVAAELAGIKFAELYMHAGSRQEAQAITQRVWNITADASGHSFNSVLQLHAKDLGITVSSNDQHFLRASLDKLAIKATELSTNIHEHTANVDRMASTQHPASAAYLRHLQSN